MGRVRWEGVTPVMAAVALYLAEYPEQRTADLAKAFATQPDTMRRYVRSLECVGLLKRSGLKLATTIPLPQLRERWGMS